MDVQIDLDTNAFYDTPSTCFWTSSVYVGPAMQAFTVDFSTGEADLAVLTTPCAARCVSP
jgi:hypothetical protein